MANPQTENGYLKIANELVKHFCKLKLSGNDWLIVWAVLLKTYGWNKKQDMISLSQFQEITGLSRPTVVRKIQRLVRYNVLGSIKGDTSTISTYWIVKDYDKWEPSSKIDTSSRFATTASKKPVVKLVAEQQHTKDTIQKTIKDKKTMSGKPDLSEPIVYLNLKASKNFSVKNKVNTSMVKARLNEGRTITDFKKVIDRKCSQWLDSDKMIDYLRPKTLFNATNFENYLNEKDSEAAGMNKLKAKFGLKED